MRAKSTRIILLTDFPEVEHPGGIVVPGASTILRRGVSERTMLWNMQKDSEVEGTVEINRSILWDVQEEDGPELTNYIEFPLWHRLLWRADPGQPNFEYGTDFQGLVRVWESGTVQMIGEGRFIQTNLPGSDTTLTDLTYYLWFGAVPGVDPGAIHAVFTVPSEALGVASAWQAVNFAGKPGAGESAWINYGAAPDTTADDRLLLWNYPNGLILPPEIYGGLPPIASSATAVEMVRDGNDIDADWGVTSDPFTTQHWGFSWEMDSTDFSSASFISHFNTSTLFGSVSGSFTRTIPDSATVGLRFQFGRGASNRTTNMFDVGPFFRTAYSTPTIQQGIDPIP